MVSYGSQFKKKKKKKVFVSVIQFQDAELYYRVVNMRDMEVQSLVNITAANYNQYSHPIVSPITLALAFFVL